MVKTGSVKAESVNKHVTLVKGAKVAWGGKQFVIERVDKGEKLAVELRTEDTVDEIAGLSVVDATGKKTAAVSRMSSTAEFAGRRIVTLGYELDATGDAFDFVIEYWTDLKAVEIPFTVRLGIGL
jgi:hypothetical protein